MGSLDNQLMSISELDELIGLNTRGEYVDDYGANVLTYVTPTINVRAKVRFINTTETERLNQEKFEQEIKIHIRQYPGLTSEYYVFWNAAYWDIYAIESTPRQRFTIIKARLIEQ